MNNEYYASAWMLITGVLFLIALVIFRFPYPLDENELALKLLLLSWYANGMWAYYEKRRKEK